jgi:hypothetical protein
VRPLAASFALALLVTGAIVLSPGARAASPALTGVLSEIGNLTQSQFDSMVAWARNGAPAPSGNSPVANAQRDVLNLGRDDRVATLYWLAGLGRSQLYARGVADWQIGSRDPSGAAAASPTPNPWRSVPLASTVLGGDVQRNVSIKSAFAAVTTDGSSFIACFSFRNMAPQVAKEIDISIPLFGGNGQQLGTIQFVRTGTFSPNIDINSYPSLAAWQGGTVGPASRMDGCVRKTYGTPQLALLQLSYASYTVSNVVYAGSSM